MARKTQISREVILEAALKMLIRDGYAAVNIKTLSKEICAGLRKQQNAPHC